MGSNNSLSHSQHLPAEMLTDRKVSTKIVTGVNTYHLQKVIASGSFGVVYDCYPYAVKKISFPHNKASPDYSKHLKEILDNEINIMRDISHQNIVRLYEVIYQDQYVYLVMEHCQCDLKMACMRKAQGQKKSVQIMLQIIKGCKQMVRRKIVHRDLKPANILCNKGIYKIADFGMAKYLETCGDSMLQSHVGTPYYMAPQILERVSYSKKCDIWSLGVIFYELLHGHLPWEGKNQIDLFISIQRQKLKINNSISQDVKDLLSRMLTVSENIRINWKELFAAFELLRKKYQETQYPTSISISRTVLFDMLNIEKERIAITEFKKNYLLLEEDQMLYVRKILEGLIAEEHQYIIREYLGEYKKPQRTEIIERHENQRKFLELNR